MFLTLARRMARLDLSTLIYRPPPVAPSRPAHERTVVVWWAGRENNGDLMLLLAHLLTVSSEWRRARIQLKSVVDGPDEARVREREMTQLREEVRIEVQVQVIERPADAEIHQVIIDHSREAEFVFLGLRLPAPGEELEYAERMMPLLEGLPSTLLVRNESEFRGQLV
jgi:hypothetical protein